MLISVMDKVVLENITATLLWSHENVWLSYIVCVELELYVVTQQIKLIMSVLLPKCCRA